MPAHSKHNFQFFDDGSALARADTLFEWCVQNGSDVARSSVKGSLAAHSGAWRQVTSDPEILKVVTSGYAPPFEEVPSAFQAKNNTTATAHAKFVIGAIAEMLFNGFAKLTKTKPLVVNPFTVSIQSNGKKRLIADLRHLNLNLKPPKFKLDNIHSALPSLRQGSYLFSFDFHKAFYHVDIDPKFQKFFGFSFSYKGQVYYGYHTIAPFGLSTLPWLFTKLMKPWIKKWREAGLHIYLYLDDGLGICRSLEEARFFAALVRGDLQNAGVLEQTLKCHWDPVKALEWLGLLIDLLSRILAIPVAKRQKAFECLLALCAKEKLTARELLKFAGLVNSMSVVIGAKAYIKTKPLFQEVCKFAQGKRGWDVKRRPSPEARACLQYWVKEMKSLSFETPIDQDKSAVILFSDASATGGAVFLHGERYQPKQLQRELQEIEERGPLAWSNKPEDMFLCTWSKQEMLQSSTWRELKTIESGLKAFGDRLNDRAVVWFTDNTGCVSISRKGSMKQALNPMADEINKHCTDRNIDLELKWLRRNKNTIADKLSRFTDLDDWGIHPSLLNRLQNAWWQCTVDRFASDRNKKLPRFNSKYTCEGSEGTDAFTVDWSGETNWLVPPPQLVPRALEHLRNCHARGILVTPFWPSAKFWPFLFTWQGPAFPVVKWMEIRRGAQYIIAGNQPGSIFTPETFKGSLLVVALDASSH